VKRGAPGGDRLSRELLSELDGEIMSPDNRSTPLRTCVGCRQRAEVSDLIRVVAIGTGAELKLQPDPRRRLPGRGAHLHLDPACFALAERRRAFGRALRVSGVIDTGPLVEHLRAVHAARGTGNGGDLGGTTEINETGRPT